MHTRSERRDSVKVTCQWGYHKLGDDYRLECRVLNHTLNTYRNMRLYYNETSYEKESFANIALLKPHNADEDGLLVRIRVRVKPGVVIEDISPNYELSLETLSPRRVIAQKRYERALQSIACPTFGRFKPPSQYEADRYNILVFGRAGACKTSMINSFYTLLNYKREICQLGNVSSGMDHCTQNIQRYEFKRGNMAAEMEEDYYFLFTDCWGLNDGNYNDFTFLKLLDGELPGGWKMDFTFQMFEKARRQKRKVMVDNIEKRRVHGVVYVITYDDIAFIGEHGNDTKKFFSKIHAKVANPIVVISQTDDNVDGFREDPLKETPGMKESRAMLSEKLGIPEMNIYFGINYVKEKKVNFRIDRKNLSILHAVLRIAEQNFPRVAKGGGKNPFDKFY